MTAWRKTAPELSSRLYGHTILRLGLVKETKDKGYLRWLEDDKLAIPHAIPKAIKKPKAEMKAQAQA